MLRRFPTVSSQLHTSPSTPVASVSHYPLKNPTHKLSTPQNSLTYPQSTSEPFTSTPPPRELSVRAYRFKGHGEQTDDWACVVEWQGHVCGVCLWVVLERQSQECVQQMSLPLGELKYVVNTTYMAASLTSLLRPVGSDLTCNFTSSVVCGLSILQSILKHRKSSFLS